VTSEGNAYGAERMIWIRAGEGDDYDIALDDPVISDAKQKRLLSLLKDVIDSDGHGIDFSKKAAAQLEEFFNNPHDPLPATAYALLSNWFATDSTYAHTFRASVAEKLWKEMGFVRLQKRLTSPDANSTILPYRFDDWWRRQQAAQDDLL